MISRPVTVESRSLGGLSPGVEQAIADSPLAYIMWPYVMWTGVPELRPYIAAGALAVVGVGYIAYRAFFRKKAVSGLRGYRRPRRKAGRR